MRPLSVISSSTPAIWVIEFCDWQHFLSSAKLKLEVESGVGKHGHPPCALQHFAIDLLLDKETAASIMGRYPVQRHRFPSRDSSIYTRYKYTSWNVSYYYLMRSRVWKCSQLRIKRHNYSRSTITALRSMHWCYSTLNWVQSLTHATDPFHCSKAIIILLAEVWTMASPVVTENPSNEQTGVKHAFAARWTILSVLKSKWDIITVHAPQPLQNNQLLVIRKYRKSKSKVEPFSTS